MAVYVDPLRSCVPNKNWRWERSCHLFADTPEELHSFAVDILHLSRSWFQGGVKTPHYDLTSSKRADALIYGAIEVEHDRSFLDFLGRIQNQWQEIAERSEG